MREEISKTKSDFEQAIFDSHLLLLGKSKLQQLLHRRLLPRSVSKWLLFRTNKSEIAKLWQIEFVDLTDVNLSQVKGLSIDQIKKEGVKYKESNLPAHIRARLSSETPVSVP